MIERQVAEKMARIDSDLLRDPTKYGFCTFEEFRKNKDKWRPNPEQALASIEQGGTLFKGRIRKMKFEFEGYPCDSVEGVQNLSKQMGFQDKDIVFYPVAHNHLAGKFDLLVRCFNKATVKQRQEW
jgi:hypothetical protein